MAHHSRSRRPPRNDVERAARYNAKLSPAAAAAVVGARLDDMNAGYAAWAPRQASIQDMVAGVLRGFAIPTALWLRYYNFGTFVDRVNRRFHDSQNAASDIADRIVLDAARGLSVPALNQIATVLTAWQQFTIIPTVAAQQIADFAVDGRHALLTPISPSAALSILDCTSLAISDLTISGTPDFAKLDQNGLHALAIEFAGGTEGVGKFHRIDLADGTDHSVELTNPAGTFVQVGRRVFVSIPGAVEAAGAVTVIDIDALTTTDLTVSGPNANPVFVADPAVPSVEHEGYVFVARNNASLIITIRVRDLDIGSGLATDWTVAGMRADNENHAIWLAAADGHGAFCQVLPWSHSPFSLPAAPNALLLLPDPGRLECWFGKSVGGGGNALYRASSAGSVSTFALPHMCVYAGLDTALQLLITAYTFDAPPDSLALANPVLAATSSPVTFAFSGGLFSPVTHSFIFAGVVHGSTPPEYCICIVRP
jgi:hypothetical protein